MYRIQYGTLTFILIAHVVLMTTHSLTHVYLVAGFSIAMMDEL